MVQLMMNLMESEMTTQEFFHDVIFVQNVKTNNGTANEKKTNIHLMES